MPKATDDPDVGSSQGLWDLAFQYATIGFETATGVTIDPLANAVSGASDAASNLSGSTVLSALQSASERPRELAGLVTNPGKFVLTRVAQFILGVILGTVFGVADIIADAFDAVNSSFDAGGDALQSGFGVLGDTLVGTQADPGALWLFQHLLTGVAEVAGPLGWIVYVAGYTLLLALLWRTTKAVLAAIPVADIIAEFLGWT